MNTGGENGLTLSFFFLFGAGGDSRWCLFNTQLLFKVYNLFYRRQVLRAYRKMLHRKTLGAHRKTLKIQNQCGGLLNSSGGFEVGVPDLHNFCHIRQVRNEVEDLAAHQKSIPHAFALPRSGVFAWESF